MNRVFISGFGILSSLGGDPAEIYSNLATGRRFFSPITRFNTAAYSMSHGAEVANAVNYVQYIPVSLLRKMDKPQKFLVYACMKAIESAGLAPDLQKQAPIYVGTAFGGTEFTERFFLDILKKGASRANPMYFPATVPNAAAGQLAIILHNQQSNQTFCHKEVSCALALKAGFRDIAAKGKQVALVGGVDELGEFLMLAIDKMGALCRTDDPAAYAPLHHVRQGYMMGEGAAFLVLESQASLEKRGAKPIAELKAVTCRSTPCSMYHYPVDSAFYRHTMERSLQQAGIGYKDIDTVLLAANSSMLDAREARAVERLNSVHGHRPACFAPKGYIGEFYASGISRLCLGLLSLQHNTLFPHPWLPASGGVNLDIYRQSVQTRAMDTLLLNSFTNGGVGCSVVVSRV